MTGFATLPRLAGAIDLWILCDVPTAHALDRVEATAARAGAGIGSLRAALERHGCDDVRRLGVVAGSAEAVFAAQRVGAGAIVGLATGPRARVELAAAEADAVIGPEQLQELLDGVGRSPRARTVVHLTTGASVTSERVLRASARADATCGGADLRALGARIEERLLALAEAPPGWAAALFPGGGVEAVEAAIRAAAPPGRPVMVCENGLAGARARRIAAAVGHPVISVEAGWAEPIDPDDVAAALAGSPTIGAVVAVHHETATGMLNPVDEIASAARAGGALVIVDATTSLGAERIDAAGVDVLCATSGGCIGGLPGLALVLCSPAAQGLAATTDPGSVALDLAAHLERTGLAEASPGAPEALLAALEAALDELDDLGGRAARRTALAEQMRIVDGAFARVGIEPLLDPLDRSSSIRAAFIPGGASFAAFRDALADDGYVIERGQGLLAASTFRVAATSAAVETARLEGFGGALERAVERLRGAAA